MLRILYAGSPDVAALPLKHLIDSKEHTIVGVLTNPAAPVGRKKDLIPTPVAQVAFAAQEQNNLSFPVLTPQKLDADFRAIVADLQPDLLVCFAYGKIFGPKFMSLFPMGGINVHPSLLPLYRGAAPVPAAILNCEKESGISIQRVSPQMDAGNILLQEKFKINPTDTSESILSLVSEQTGSLLLTVLKQLEEKTIKEYEQDHSKATYCTTLSREDGIIDWSLSATQIVAKVHAYNPKPLAYTSINDIQLILHNAHVYTNENNQFDETANPGFVLGVDKKEGILIQSGNGIVAATHLQWQAKKAVNWKDFINGSRDIIGSVCK